MTWEDIKIVLLILAGIIVVWLWSDLNNQWNECVDKHGEEWCRVSDIKGEANSVIITELDN